MQRYALGDLGAFDELFTRHKHFGLRFNPGIYRERRSCGDLFQNVFIRLVNARNNTSLAKFTTWLFNIPARFAWDEFRKKRGNLSSRLILAHRSDGEDPILTIPGDMPIPDRAYRPITNSHAKIIANLPEAQREILLLREKTNLTFKKSPRSRDVPPTPSKAMHYALLALRQGLKDRGYETR